MFERFKPPAEETCVVDIRMYRPHMDEMNEMIATIIRVNDLNKMRAKTRKYPDCPPTVTYRFRIPNYTTARTEDEKILSLEITFQKDFTPYIREFCNKCGSYIQNANEIESNQRLLQWLEETKTERVRIGY